MNPKLLRKKATRVIERNEKLRSCGTCTACCTSLGVAELGKLAGVPCRHEIPLKGCSIYANRPGGCVEWSCMWKLGLFDGFDRPDRVGVVIDATEHNERWPRNFAFIAREAMPDGFKKAADFLYKISRDRIVVLVSPDGTRKLIGPPNMIAYVEREIQLVEGDPELRHRLPVI